MPVFMNGVGLPETPGVGRGEETMKHVSIITSLSGSMLITVWFNASLLPTGSEVCLHSEPP